MRHTASELAAHLGGELVGPDVGIDGASIDSRTIRPGQLYAPIVAERGGHAGHDPLGSLVQHRGVGDPDDRALW